MMTGLLDALIDLVKKTDEARIVSDERLPNHLYIQHGAELHKMAVEAPLRQHLVSDIESFLLAAKTWGNEGVIFHGERSIELVIDDGQRRDFVWMDLRPSAQLEYLQRLPLKLNQRDLIRALRMSLDVDRDIVSRFRKVDFNRRSDGTSSIEHGKETLGRAVESSISGTDGIPEEFPITFPVYENGMLRHSTARTVLANVDVLIEEQQFYLALKPGELNEAIERTQTDIGEMLRDSDLPVFHGSFAQPEAT